MRTFMTKSILFTGLVAVVAAGCGADLPVASQLERTRVLGARVVVPGEPGRASVQPGEAAEVEWLLAGPTAPASLDWAFALCTGAGGSCADTPQPIGTGTGAPVVVPFTTPDAGALTDGKLPQMLGTICADGTLTLDPASQTPGCVGAGASGTLTRFTIPVTADGATANLHPVLSNDVLELSGTLWDPATATAVAGEPCDASSGLPVVTATPAGVEEVEQKIRIVSDGDDRETFTPTGETAARLEELQISNFATAGEFDSSYAAIFPADLRPDADVTVKWTPPKAADVPAEGKVVAFYFAFRDLRGGLDWTSRAMCVVAP